MFRENAGSYRRTHRAAQVRVTSGGNHVHAAHRARGQRLRHLATAYRGFVEHRGRAGVVADRVARPVHDDAYVVIDLDFPSADQAESFRRFLQDRVWASRDLSPALAGKPRAEIFRRESGTAVPATAGATAALDDRA